MFKDVLAIKPLLTGFKKLPSLRIIVLKEILPDCTSLKHRDIPELPPLQVTKNSNHSLNLKLSAKRIKSQQLKLLV